MSGPLVVVIAGIYTAWIAVKTNDGLVTEDYYKKGLAAGQTIARSEQATRLGLAAHIRLNHDSISVRLKTTSLEFVQPESLSATLSHPTRAGLDQVITLARTADGYTSAMRLPSAGHWLLLVEDEKKTWRLMGNVVLPANGELLIGGPAPTAPPTDIRNP
jgi:hypothetical protein